MGGNEDLPFCVWELKHDGWMRFSGQVFPVFAVGDFCIICDERSFMYLLSHCQWWSGLSMAEPAENRHSQKSGGAAGCWVSGAGVRVVDKVASATDDSDTCSGEWWDRKGLNIYMRIPHSHLPGLCKSLSLPGAMDGDCSGRDGEIGIPYLSLPLT